MKLQHRRTFLKDLGLSAASLPFLSGLPSLFGAEAGPGKRQRLIFMFSPNGTIPEEFWPEISEEPPVFKRILEPLNAFREQTLVLRGVANQIRGDGDNHMRGMSCLLTGTELLPGNIQGGSHTPAGWASGISIDQEIRNALQKQEATRTRFGSLEVGVAVPDRADPWTRMSYAGPNKPLAPIADPELMLGKLYGNARDKESLLGIVDGVKADLERVSRKLSAEDRALLEDHLALVREMEIELASSQDQDLAHPMPEIDPNIELVNDNTPQLSRMQIDLLVNAMANDMARVATLQFMRSVGQARMAWLGIGEGHHTLSHDPDKNTESREKLIKINRWFAEELAYLAQKLRDTPEPGGDGSMLDHTLIVWINELGKGNSHTLDDIPIVMIGGAPGIRMGRSLDLAGRIEEKKKIPATETEPEKEVVVKVRRKHLAHNRLWLKVSESMGHPLDHFGTEKYCAGGALDLG